MAEEEKEIELPVEPVNDENLVGGEPGVKKGTNVGVIWLSIITGIACLVIIYYVFIKKDKYNNRGNFNTSTLNSRTISSNSGYGGNFNGTGSSYSTKTF